MMFYDKDLINLAPRKPDWDLKRDVAKKLEKLERRTQRAIAELISMHNYIYRTIQLSKCHIFMNFWKRKNSNVYSFFFQGNVYRLVTKI